MGYNLEVMGLSPEGVSKAVRRFMDEATPRIGVPRSTLRDQVVSAIAAYETHRRASVEEASEEAKRHAHNLLVAAQTVAEYDRLTLMRQLREAAAYIARLDASHSHPQPEPLPQTRADLGDCRCGKRAQTTYDGDRMCLECARADAHRDLEEQEMPGGFGES